MRKMILFEINELPYFVLDDYCRRHPDSHLAKLLPVCTQYETVTEDSGHLSPWITWPTFHRGVHNEQHGIQDFGEKLDEIDAKYPPVWKILKRAGKRTGVFLSMHSYPVPADYEQYAFYVADPFAGESTSNPKRLEPFQRFNLAMSRRSARNVDGGIDLKSAGSLLLSLPGLGLRPRTLGRVAAQLVEERRRPWVKTRRRSFQSLLAFDVFMRLMREQQPDFTTCFSNHVASTLHRYWAAAYPEHYDQIELGPEWREQYKGEIDYVMDMFDEFFGTLVEFAGQHPEYVLVFASSMGQKATDANVVRSEVALKNPAFFLQRLGLTAQDWEPRNAMHPQYNIQLTDTSKIASFRTKLEALAIGGQKFSYREKENGFFSLDFGHKNLKDETVLLDGQQGDFEGWGLWNEPIEDETGSTAYHIPEGICLIYDPQDLSRKGPRISGINSKAVAPSILKFFGLPVPAYMVQERLAALAAQPVTA